MGETIRVLLADDHALIRAGIRATLATERELLLVGEATDGAMVRRLCRDLQPDVLLLDLHMPGPPAIATLAYVHVHCPTTKILVLTAYDDDVYVQEMLSAGVAGYVLKDEATEVVVQAIRMAARGGIWFSQAVVLKLISWQIGTQSMGHTTPLTEREIAVVRLVVVGKTNQEIGAALGISEKTVEKHLSEVFVKWKVKSRVEAAVRAVREGLG